MLFRVSLFVVVFAALAALLFPFSSSSTARARAPFIPIDSGSDHTYCCDSWRGCWAYRDEVGWVKFREHDCVTWPWQVSPFNLWRCHTCPKPHLPREGTRHPRQVPNPNPKG